MKAPAKIYREMLDKAQYILVESSHLVCVQEKR